MSFDIIDKEKQYTVHIGARHGQWYAMGLPESMTIDRKTGFIHTKLHYRIWFLIRKYFLESVVVLLGALILVLAITSLLEVPQQLINDSSISCDAVSCVICPVNEPCFSQSR